MIRRRVIPTVVAVAAVFAFATGCSAQEQPRPVPSKPAASAPVEEPVAPAEFVPGGTAEENLPFFNQVLSTHVSQGGAMDRASIVAVLTASGWTADVVEATKDATPLGNATDAVSFAVRSSDGCIVGQWNGAFTSAVMPLLASGSCLAGTQTPVS